MGSNKAEAEADYKYTAKTGTCHSSDYTGLFNSTGFKQITANSSSSLMASIQTGPTSVAIEADKAAFQTYKSGILNSEACGTKIANNGDGAGICGIQMAAVRPTC